jgi:RsiW-degrading membrane proteinase PrsW (M82 family)
MIVTTIAALLYLAYKSFFLDLAKAKTAQVVTASVLVGIIALVLVVAAAFLVVDGWKALRKPRQPVEEAASRPA